MDLGFVSKFSGFFKLNSVTRDDDFIDRLNHHVTSSLLLICTALVSGKTYVGQPLQCAAPHHFNKAMEQYAENYCFVQNTYFVAHHEEIPAHIERDDREITYYQWIPFVLALQALMFYLPAVIWRSLNWKSGIHVSSIVKLAADSQLASLDDRKKKLSAVVEHLYEGLHTQKERKTGWSADMRQSIAKYCCCIAGRKYGNYLTMLYLFVKMLYLINVIGQFFLMNAFLSSKWTSFYGFELIYDLSTGHEWYASGRFPRVTFCDFEMRVLGNVQRHTIQCVLMINMFNEKIYIFLWWWCFFVAVLTILSFFSCLIDMLAGSRRASTIERFLKMGRLPKAVPRTRVEEFTEKKLRKDGVLMVRIISDGAGSTVAYDVVSALWAKCNQLDGAESASSSRSDNSRGSDEKSPDYAATKMEDL